LGGCVHSYTSLELNISLNKSISLYSFVNDAKENKVTVKTCWAHLCPNNKSVRIKIR